MEGFYGGSPVEVVFWAENTHSVDHCYAVELTVPEGWTLFSPEAQGICIQKNSTEPVYAYVTRPLGENTLGEVGEVGLTLTEVDDGAITASSTARGRSG